MALLWGAGCLDAGGVAPELLFYRLPTPFETGSSMPIGASCLDAGSVAPELVF